MLLPKGLKRKRQKFYSYLIQFNIVMVGGFKKKSYEKRYTIKDDMDEQ